MWSHFINLKEGMGAYPKTETGAINFCYLVHYETILKKLKIFKGLIHR